MNLRKRGLALLMCICMVFTLLPFSVFAENDTSDDTGSAAQPSVVYGTYDENGEWTQNSEITNPAQTDGNVTYSKTAAPAAGEDTYDITLNVSTTVKKSAVVLVLDTSKSSLDCADCGQSYSEEYHKTYGDVEGNGHKGDCDYYEVKYKLDENGKPIQATEMHYDKNRQPIKDENGKVIWFPKTDKDGNPVYVKAGFTSQPITDEQNFLAAEKASAKKFIENYAGSIAETGKYIQVVSYQGTANKALTEWVDVSTADGMKKAVEAIDALQYDSAATNEGKNLEQGLAKAYDCVTSAPAGVANKYVIAVTNSWFDKAGKDGNGDLTWGAYDTANKLKDKNDGNSTVYTVYSRNHDSPKNQDTKVDLDNYLKEKVASPSCAYENTDTGVRYKASWLKTTVSETILAAMKLDTVPAFTVTDPMSKYVTLKSATLTDSKITTDENGIKTITWTPTAANAKVDSNGNVVYSLSYTVKINTGAEDFEYSTWYPTNGETTLKINDNDALSFIVPGVKAERKTVDWDVSCSKTATELDENYQSKVTLSLPSAATENVIDVVFVVDNAFPQDNNTAAVQARALMDQLNNLSKKSLKVNVGLVISGGYVPVLDSVPLGNISDTNEKIQDFLDKSESDWKAKEGRKGSNIQAGIEAARDMLNAETTASKENKFLILISDGGAFSWYDKDTNKTWAKFFENYEAYSKKNYYYWCNPGDFGSRYTEHGETQRVNRSFSDLMTMDETTIDAYSIADPGTDAWPSTNARGDKQYEGHYAAEEIQSFLDAHQGEYAESATVNNLDNDYVTSREAALYHTTQSIKAASSEANVIFVSFAYYYTTPDGHTDSNLFRYTEEFKNYLEDNKYVTLYRVNGDAAKYNYPEGYDGVGTSEAVFKSIKNDLIYLVDAGSTVVDTMGKDFDFVSLDTMKLTVGGTELAKKIDGNVAYFAGSDDKLNDKDCSFKVVYDSDKDSFTWYINEAVTREAPVQLTYTVKLTNVSTTPGTHGQLDLDGDKIIDDTGKPVEPSKALYTNESAVLTPIATNGNKGVAVEFPKPSLAYTVEKPPVDPTVRNKITVEITGNSDSVVYDGTEHSVKDYTVKISDSRYTEKDFTFSGKALASGVNAGTYEMGLKADQFKNTNARFTNVEFVIKADGALTITQRPLTITAGSAEGIAPVTSDEYTVEGLATGDKVDSVKLTGVQSEPGESPNVASDAVIKNAKGEDVTASYKITYVNGVLKAIEVLNKEIHFNYVIGYTDGTIRPDNNISRAEVATIFFRLLTDEAREQYTTTAANFTDVKDGMWCNRAVATLTNMGIIKGYTDGSFRPNAQITRAELATIIARFAKLDVNTKTFSDINGHWAQKNIELAAGNGWINGYEDGTFRPNNNITRAETFAMINRVLDRQTESVSDLLPTSDMNMWSDNMDADAWYYKDVQEATNYHKCDRVGDSVYEKWTEKVPDIDWASYQI